MATVQGDVVDSVTTALAPMSQDDTPISAPDILNSTTAPELLKLAAKEHNNVTPALETPDMHQLDKLTKDASVSSNAETDVPVPGVDDVDIDAADDGGLASEPAPEVAATTDLKDNVSETPASATEESYENTTPEAVAIDVDVEQPLKATEPIPTKDEDVTEDKADSDIAPNTTVEGIMQPAAEESLTAINEPDAVSADDISNAIAPTEEKLSKDEAEMKELSKDDAQDVAEKEELNAAMSEAEADVNTYNATALSATADAAITSGKTSEPSTEEAASATTEAEVPTDDIAEATAAPDAEVSEEVSNEFDTKDDALVNDELPETNEEAEAPAPVVETTVLEDGANAIETESEPVKEVLSSKSTTSDAVDDTVKGEEAPEGVAPIPVEDEKEAAPIIGGDNVEASDGTVADDDVASSEPTVDTETDVSAEITESSSFNDVEEAKDEEIKELVAEVATEVTESAAVAEPEPETEVVLEPVIESATDELNEEFISSSVEAAESAADDTTSAPEAETEVSGADTPAHEDTASALVPEGNPEPTVEEPEAETLSTGEAEPASAAPEVEDAHPEEDIALVSNNVTDANTEAVPESKEESTDKPAADISAEAELAAPAAEDVESEEVASPIDIDVPQTVTEIPTEIASEPFSLAGTGAAEPTANDTAVSSTKASENLTDRAAEEEVVPTEKPVDETPASTVALAEADNEAPKAESKVEAEPEPAAEMDLETSATEVEDDSGDGDEPATEILTEATTAFEVYGDATAPQEPEGAAEGSKEVPATEPGTVAEADASDSSATDIEVAGEKNDEPASETLAEPGPVSDVTEEFSVVEEPEVKVDTSAASKSVVIAEEGPVSEAVAETPVAEEPEEVPAAAETEDDMASDKDELAIDPAIESELVSEVAPETSDTSESMDVAEDVPAAAALVDAELVSEDLESSNLQGPEEMADSSAVPESNEINEEKNQELVSEPADVSGTPAASEPEQVVEEKKDEPAAEVPTEAESVSEVLADTSAAQEPEEVAEKTKNEPITETATETIPVSEVVVESLSEEVSEEKDELGSEVIGNAPAPIEPEEVGERSAVTEAEDVTEETKDESAAEIVAETAPENVTEEDEPVAEIVTETATEEEVEEVPVTSADTVVEEVTRDAESEPATETDNVPEVVMSVPQEVVNTPVDADSGLAPTEGVSEKKDEPTARESTGIVPVSEVVADLSAELQLAETAEDVPVLRSDKVVDSEARDLVVAVQDAQETPAEVAPEAPVVTPGDAETEDDTDVSPEVVDEVAVETAAAEVPGDVSAEKPSIAINTDVVDSSEIDTPSLITDATSAAGSSARPWTPSFQVTTVGRGISPVQEVEIADAESEDVSVPVITTDIGVKNEIMEVKPPIASTEASDMDGNLIPPRPWTPSYSVHSQGSPMLAPVDAEPVDGAVRDEDYPDVSEIEFAENPELPPPATNAPKDVPPVESASTEADEQPGDVTVAAAAISNSETETAITQDMEELVKEEEASEEMPEKSEIGSGPSIVEPIPVLSEQSVDEVVETSESDVKASEDTTQQPSPSSSWVPSYSVSRQGSPLVELQELPATDQSSSVSVPEPVQPAEAIEPPVIETEEKTAQADVADPNVPALNELSSTFPVDSSATKEQPVSSSWVPSYSVSKQGSPLPEVRSLAGTEDATDSLNVANDSTKEVLISQPDPTAIERPVTPIVVVTPDEESANVPKGPVPERPWTPSYSTTTQGPASPSKSPAVLDTPAEFDTSATDIQVEVVSAPEIAVTSTDGKGNTMFPTSVETATQSSIATLPSVDENAVSEATSAVIEPPITTRKRVESTTSSRFFPGGWFSTSPKIPDEGRTSLEVAQGEFTSSKAVPADDVSDIIPDSASEVSTSPDEAAADEAEKEKKSGRWCVIM